MPKTEAINGEADVIPEDGIPQQIPGTEDEPAPRRSKDRAPKQPGAARGAAGRFVRKAAAHDHPHEPKPTKRVGRPMHKATREQLRKDVERTLNEVCGMLMVAGLVSPKLAYDAAIIQSNADKLAVELVRLGERAEWVDRALRALVTMREGSQVLVLVGTIIIPIAANHGLLPAGTAQLVGAPQPPDAGQSPDLSSIVDLFAQRPADPEPQPAAQPAEPAPHVPAGLFSE